MVAEQSGTYARGTMVLVNGKLIRLIQRSQNFLADSFSLLSRFKGMYAQIFQHHHELVTAKTRYSIPFPHTGFQSMSHLFQQHVANIVTQRIVE